MQTLRKEYERQDDVMGYHLKVDYYPKTPHPEMLSPPHIPQQFYNANNNFHSILSIHKYI